MQGGRGLTSKLCTDYDAVCAGHCLQPGALRLAVLEPQRADPWVVGWGEVEKVVVWGEQLGHTRQDGSHEVGDERIQERQYDVGVYMMRPQNHGVYYIWAAVAQLQAILRANNSIMDQESEDTTLNPTFPTRYRPEAPLLDMYRAPK